MKSSNSFIKLLAGGVVIFIAAAGGMYLGGKLSNSSGQSAAQPQEILTNLTLGPGKQFPDIELIDGLYNPATSKSILDENGTVILFMDHQCPPCKDVAQFWQKMIEDGAVNKTQVVGICFANAANIYEIHNKYQIDFPIYADERYTFLDHYGVDAFPLVLIVDELGMITYIESDSNVKIDRDELKKRLQG